MLSRGWYFSQIWGKLLYYKTKCIRVASPYKHLPPTSSYPTWVWSVWNITNVASRIPTSRVLLCVWASSKNSFNLAHAHQRLARQQRRRQLDCSGVHLFSLWPPSLPNARCDLKEDSRYVGQQRRSKSLYAKLCPLPCLACDFDQWLWSTIRCMDVEWWLEQMESLPSVLNLSNSPTPSHTGSLYTSCFEPDSSSHLLWQSS